MHHEQALEKLRLQGHRVTPQRLLVLSVMAEGRQHMGVDEVFRRAREAYQFMDIATVYRTLRLFKDAGVVTEVEIGDRLHYELTLPDDLHHQWSAVYAARAFNPARYLFGVSRYAGAGIWFSRISNTLILVCCRCQAAVRRTIHIPY